MKNILLIIIFVVIVEFLDGEVRKYEDATGYVVYYNKLCIENCDIRSKGECKRLETINWMAIKTIKETK